MRIIACDGCGVVLCTDNLKWVPEYLDSSRKILNPLVVISLNGEHLKTAKCPVCNTLVASIFSYNKGKE